MKRLCPNCFTSINTTDKFCYKCGYKIEEDTIPLDVKVCPKCNKVSASIYNYCDKCGELLVEQSSTIQEPNVIEDEKPNVLKSLLL